jgi:integrase
MKGFIRATEARDRKTQKTRQTFAACWETRDPATGNRRQHIKRGFATKRAAQEYLNEMLGRVASGGGRPDTQMTVGHLLDQWLAAHSGDVRPSTAVMYTNVINGWLKPHVGGVRLSVLNASRAAEVAAVLRSPAGSRLGRGGLSDRSVQLAMATLKQATAWAWRSGLIAADPLLGYRRPRSGGSSKATGAWSADEAGAFLASVADDKLRAAWWLFLSRGLRRGELCGLQWSDLDLERGTLSVLRTRVMVAGQAINSVPKTEAGVRRISLDRRLIEELRAHADRQQADRRRAAEAWQESDRVFVDELGAPILPQTVSRRFDALVAVAGVRRIRLHDLRHSAASQMLEAGTPVPKRHIPNARTLLPGHHAERVRTRPPGPG